VDSRAAEGDPARLVIAGGVEGQLADQGAVVGEDADVVVGDEEVDGFAAVSPAEADVVEAAEVAERCLFSLISVGQGGISQREGVTGTKTVAGGEV
jgi:hypothetical protein